MAGRDLALFGNRHRAAFRVWVFWLLAVASIWTAHAAELDLVKAEELLRAGRYAEAYELLEPFEAENAGDLRFDYLLARSALGSGRPSKASFVYERILAIEPNYVGVRLEMGRAYLALGDYARAKLEFETVLRFENLPPDIREQAAIYARAAERYLSGQRAVGYGYAEYGFGYDSNPLSLTSRRSVVIAGNEVLLQDRKSDHYHALSFGGELVHSLTNRFSLYAGADARGRIYNDVDAADFGSLDGRAGLGYSEARTSARLGAVVGSYRLDNATLRQHYGLTTDWRYLLGTQDQAAVTLSATRYRYATDATALEDFDLYQASVGWLRSVNSGRGAVGLTLLLGLEDATKDRLDGDKPFFGGRLTVQNAFTDRVGAFLVAGFQHGEYSRPNATFEVTRRDTLYDATIGVTWAFAPGWSLRPQVLYIKNNSNIPTNEFDKTEISVNVRRDF
jgi:outer membrane protein